MTRYASIILCAACLGAPMPAMAQARHETRSFLAMAKNIDWSCLKMEIAGPCAEPEPGVYIRYWEPALVMETVHGPGEYVIQETGAVVGPLARKAANLEMSLATKIDKVDVTSTSGRQSAGGSNLQFHEVHLYDFPLKLLEDVVLCPSVPNTTLGLRYLSEADSVQWRMQPLEKFLPQVQLAGRLRMGHVGSWGPLYPRTGFAIGASSAITSGLDALRAVSIGSTGILSGHIVESPLDFEMNMSTDKMQMIYPEKSMCMSPGADPRLWEPGRVSRDGNYVWIYWRYRECCKSIVPQST